MSTDVINDFIDKKKSESEFVKLADGESTKILALRELKVVTTMGFGGDEKEVLRLIVDVETPYGIKTKKFDNPTQRFANELVEKGVGIGSTFKLSRSGLQTKTVYTISDVKNVATQAKAV